MIRRLCLAIFAAAFLAAPAAAQATIQTVSDDGEYVEGYRVATGVAMGLNAIALYANTRPQHDAFTARFRGAAGVAAGGAAMVLGLAGFADDAEGLGVLPPLNFIVGAATFGLGARNLVAPRLTPWATLSLGGHEATLTAAPLVSARGAGVGVNLRF